MNWFSGHLLGQRSSRFVAMLLLAAVLEAAAMAGLSYVAGFGLVGDAFGRVSWPWLIALVGGLAVSFGGYLLAYRGVYGVEEGPLPPVRELIAVAVGGFGGIVAHSGSALDVYALQASGADEREAKVRSGALAGLEHGALAVIGTAAAIAVLVQGLAAPTGDFTIPWAVIPVPGFALAFWLAERHRERLRHRRGWSGRTGVFFDSIHLNRELFLRQHRHGPAAFGMVVFWVADAFAMWAALAAFGFRMNAAALFIGYATGTVFTRRTGPVAGAGILMVVLPVTIWYSGAPLATAVVAVFAYRLAALWLPLPFAIASLPTLHAMGDAALVDRT